MIKNSDSKEGYLSAITSVYIMVMLIFHNGNVFISIIIIDDIFYYFFRVRFCFAEYTSRINAIVNTINIISTYLRTRGILLVFSVKTAQL